MRKLAWVPVAFACAPLPLLGVLPVAGAAGERPQIPHRHKVEAGRHPRLLASPEELPALRAKVREEGTLAARLWTEALRGFVPRPEVPGFQEAIEETAPAAAMLAPTEEERKALSRAAIDSALAVIRKWDPPYYPAKPEHWEWLLAHQVILTYDCCYGHMTEAERSEFQDEMIRLCTFCVSNGAEATMNNHWLKPVQLAAMAAIAMEGDVKEKPLRFVVPVVRGKNSTEGDFLPHRSDFRILDAGLSPGEDRFREGRDFKVQWIGDETLLAENRLPRGGRGIRWDPGAKGLPADKSMYFVTYEFTPDLARWKELGRLATQRYHDYLWCDGASMAGPLYGGLTLRRNTDVFEVLRRSDGIDFSRHPGIQDAVFWIASEMLPGPGLRTNVRNDASDRSFDIFSDGRISCGWALGRYAGDAQGRDTLARWLLGRLAAQKPNWREALWAPAGPSDPPEGVRVGPARSRFFRGHNLASFRWGDWDGPEEDWALFTLSAGPCPLPEHDHTDKGAFTFHALGEEFAIDSGSAHAKKESDATAAHNYLLYDGKGQAGPHQSCGFVRAHFLSDPFDAVSADLAKSYTDIAKWPATPAPGWPVRRADRHAVFVKIAGRAPYVVVCDSFDVDGKPHDFEWLLHTQTGNKISIEGSTATVTGKSRGNLLRVHGSSLRQGRQAFRQDAWTTSQSGTHPRLIAPDRGENPWYLMLLVPERKGEASPLAVRFEEGKGIRLARVRRPGGEELVVSARGAPARLGDIETDAALAIVRAGGGAGPSAWLVMDGSVLKYRGTVLWEVTKPRQGRGSACFDGAALSVEAPEASRFEAWAPYAASFRAGDRTLPAKVSGNLLRWQGARRLEDSYPEGVAAMSEDFGSGCAPYWFTFPLKDTGFARPVDGQFCLPGLRTEWLSYTRRHYNTFIWPPQLRADIFQWPRCLFSDARLEGEIALVDWEDGKTFAICGRVSDRRFLEDAVDQDRIEARIDPAKGECVLSKRIGGAATRLASGKAGPFAKGEKFRFELSLKGGGVSFRVNGGPAIRASGGKDPWPAKGYFQWETEKGVHLHLDDVRISIP